MSRREQSRGIPVYAWVFGSALLLAGAGVVVQAIEDGGADHPEPRPDVTAERVVPEARYAGYPRIAQVYEAVAEVPHVIDGVYCHCDCSEHSGHRSLLTCFESDHGARCDVCLSSAVMVYRMNGQGHPLDQIRQAVDDSFGG